MNILVVINWAVLAVLVPLFALEVGAALLYLLDYDTYKEKLERHIALSWEISGTFVVFFLVNFEATYPGLLVALGTLYLAPILLAGAVVIIRDAYLAYSEYTKDVTAKKRDSKIYAVSTLVAAFLFVSILSSLISGIGVNVQSLSVDFVSLLFNAFNISVFLGVVALSFVAAFVTFQVKSLAAYALDSLAAMIAFVSAMFLYLPYLSQAVMSYYYINFVPAALFVALTLLHLRRSRHAEIFVFLWLIASSMVFSAFVYPYLFGGTVNVNAALPQASSAFYVLLISIFGAVFLAIAIGVLLYARSRAGRGPPRGRH